MILMNSKNVLEAFKCQQQLSVTRGRISLKLDQDCICDCVRVRTNGMSGYVSSSYQDCVRIF
jgi:hypothetical protein